MIDRDEQPTLFGMPIVVDPAMRTDEVRLVSPTFREMPNPALQDRAAFVRYHVGEILKKEKTVASYRTQGKKMLERAEEAGDTGMGDEAQALYRIAEHADALAEQHYAALIARTRIEP